MPDNPSLPRQLTLVRWVLLGFAVLTTAGAAAVLAFAVNLLAAGYSGGSNPESIAPLAIPLAFVVLAVVGLPAALICAVTWAGYVAVARRKRTADRLAMARSPLAHAGSRAPLICRPAARRHSRPG